MSDEHLKSVVHRRGSLTKDDYREAISDLARAMVQDEVRHICCSVCEDTGHTAETCHHNPLILARRWSEATSVWCCYHCGFVATNDEEARDHFGFNEQVKAKCLRKPPSQTISRAHLADWVRKTMRFIDLCDADAAGYDELHHDAAGLIDEGFALFGIDVEENDDCCLADLEHLPLKECL